MIAWGFLSVSDRMREIKSHILNIDSKCIDIDGVIVLSQYHGNHFRKILVEYLEHRTQKLGINNIIIVEELTIGNDYSLRNLQIMGMK